MCTSDRNPPRTARNSRLSTCLLSSAHSQLTCEITRTLISLRVGGWAFPIANPRRITAWPTQHFCGYRTAASRTYGPYSAPTGPTRALGRAQPPKTVHGRSWARKRSFKRYRPETPHHQTGTPRIIAPATPPICGCANSNFPWMDSRELLVRAMRQLN